MVITNYMLMQKIAEVNKKSRSLPSVKTQRASILEEEGTVALFEDKIVKVQGEYVYTSKNEKAKLFNPIPCLYWKCTTTPDSNGVSTLKKQLDALFINDGTNIYCIGVMGASDEFEVRFHVGNSEVRMNNTWLNLKADHIVQNGLEVKK